MLEADGEGTYRINPNAFALYGRGWFRGWGSRLRAIPKLLFLQLKYNGIH
jgi:hypothetical protein